MQGLILKAPLSIVVCRTSRDTTTGELSIDREILTPTIELNDESNTKSESAIARWYIHTEVLTEEASML